MELSALSAAAPVQPLADNMVQMSHLDEKSVLVRPRLHASRPSSCMLNLDASLPGRRAHAAPRMQILTTLLVPLAPTR